MIAGTADAGALVSGVFARAFAARERLTVSQWAERHRVITGGDNAGPWDNNVTPYLVGVMDAMSDPAVRRVSFMKSEQVGGTEAIFNMVMWSVSERPGPLLYIYPNQDVARRVNKERLGPTLRACEAIRGLFGSDRYDDTALHLGFTNGARANFAGSNSDSNIETFAYRNVFIDELDRCADGITGKVLGRVTSFPDHTIVEVGTPGLEGVGIDAAYAASDRRRWWTPCPHPGCGRYHVRDDFRQVGWPCPVDEKGKRRPYDADPDVVRRSAWYACPACAHKIRPHEHRETSRRGVWLPAGWEARAAGDAGGPESPPPGDAGEDSPRLREGLYAGRPSTPEGVEAVWTGAGTDLDEPPGSAGSHAGFSLSGMMSTIAPNPFGKVAEEWVRQRGPSQDWANRRLGKAWAVRGDRVELSQLRALCVPVTGGGYPLGHCFPDALCVLLTVDIQADRAYAEFRAWGERGKVTGLVWAEEIPVSEGGDLSELEPLLERRFPVFGRGDLTIPVGAAAFDSSFFTTRVYALVDRLRRRRAGRPVPIFPLKGDGSKAMVQPITENEVDSRFGFPGLRIMRIKSNVWKQSLLERIRGEGSIHRGPEGEGEGEGDDGFDRGGDRGGERGGDAGTLRYLLPEGTPEEYLLQLTSEHRVSEMVAGQPVAVFKPRPGFENRNHFFDTAHYQMALAYRVGVYETTKAQFEMARERISAGAAGVGAGVGAGAEQVTPAKAAEARGPRTPERPARFGGRGILDRGRG